MSRIPSPLHTTSALNTRLIGLTAALTLALAGCQAPGPEPGTQVEFEVDSVEPTLIKPAPEMPTFATKGTPPVAPEAPQVEVVSTARDEEKEEEERPVNCSQDESLGNLSVEIGGPSAAFEGDDISEYIKVVLISDSRIQSPKAEVSVHLSKDESLDEGDLILSAPDLVASSPEMFSELLVEVGKLQPLVGIDPGNYQVFVRIDEHISDSNCFLDDNTASFPLEVI